MLLSYNEHFLSTSPGPSFCWMLGYKVAQPLNISLVPKFYRNGLHDMVGVKRSDRAQAETHQINEQERRSPIYTGKLQERQHVIALEGVPQVVTMPKARVALGGCRFPHNFYQHPIYLYTHFFLDVS